MATIIQDLYKAFIEKDASLAEINPLVLTPVGTLLAIDAKMVFDDNALYRHPTYRSYQSPQKMRSWKRLPKKEDSAMCAWTAR